MNKKIIDLMKLFGYDFIEEKPTGRLLFYETDWEDTVQIWRKKTIKESMEITSELIKVRLIERAKSMSRYEV